MGNGMRQTHDFVWRKIERLKQSKNESAARAILAKLRRGVGKPPGSMPELWDITLDGLPEPLLGRDAPSRGEYAVHTALTLFALHQQGKALDSKCMSKEGVALGTAVRRLVSTPDDEERVKRRFDAAATADSMAEFAHHLRGLVQLLRAGDIPLDYPALAEDLYRFQIPEFRDNVRLGWGRDFYHIKSSAINDDGIENTKDGKDETNDEK